MVCGNIIGPVIPLRFIIAGTIGLGCLVYALNRGNMSIIILAMTKNPYNSSIELPDYGPRYEWSTCQQSLVLGAYFWGNAVSCAIAGIFAGRYGARNILGYAFGLVALLLAVSSVAGRFLWLTIFIRFLTGIAMGGLTPSIQEIIRKWAPPDERGFFLALLQFTGIVVVIDWLMSGYIIEKYGWMWAFYVVAVIFAIFSLVWFIVIYDSPSEHPRITEREKEFIMSQAISSYDKKRVHSFSLTKTGLWASLPYFVRIPASITFGYIGDTLVRRKAMSTNAIRKWFSICSHCIPGCFLFGITYVGDNSIICLAFITVATAFHSAIVITCISNMHDLAPNFASAICGLTSLIGYSSGYLAPLVVAYFTRNQSTNEKWRKIFFVGAGIFIGTNIIFVLFGSDNVQKWNYTEEEVLTSEEEARINTKDHMKMNVQ